MAKGNPQMPYQVPELKDVREYNDLLKEIEKRTKQINEWISFSHLLSPTCLSNVDTFYISLP